MCKLKREDYFECLHHRKEHDRIRQIAEQQKKNEQGDTHGHGGGH